MKRSKQTLSHYRMHTCDMGELIPIQCVPVLPGDTMQGNQSILIRVSPLNTPVMHPVTVRAHTWYVPNRVVWPESEGGGWEQFITGGPLGTDSQEPPREFATNDKKAVHTFLGVPPGTLGVYNTLSLRAYNQIWNSRYRDQDLATERAVNENALANIAWEKDDLTTARPWTQKGAAVSIPIGDTAPIQTAAPVGGKPSVWSTFENEQHLMDASAVSSHVELDSVPDAGKLTALEADLSNASTVDINEFRAGFALQRYQEARARYGSRFVEYLRYLGIRPSDARLQEPEYISGGTARLNFSEVLQTSPNDPGTDQNGIGDLYGHGIAGLRTPKFRKFFEEHGYLITLLSVRPKAVYMNGCDREFLKRNKEDFFQRELANLGQQEVWNGQVFHNQPNYLQAFGYQDRYDEYRKHPSQVGQDFRDTLNSWHLARELDVNATLNESFIECNPSKRIFQVETNDVLWVMSNNHLVARRQVPKRANPRII